MLQMLTHSAHDHPPTCAASSAANVSYLAKGPLALLGSYLRAQTPSPSPSPSPNSKPDPATAAPAPPRPVSSSSAGTDDKASRRPPRPKTSYILAQPPPAVMPCSKLHLRPKVLLQLHQVLAAERPKPVYDVIPCALLELRSTRRLARTFNTRERLGHNDFLVVKAEDYGSASEKPRADDEKWDLRQVVGVICPGKTDKGVVGKAEICMDDGTSRWEVTPLPNGGYEFNTTSENGLPLKARWVLKSSASRRGTTASAPATPSAGSEDNRKFTFSTISPGSRRHPIIATMTRTRLDVLDAYTVPSTTSPPSPTPLAAAQEQPLTPASIDLDSFAHDASSRAPIPTGDALRQFIVVSGIWVGNQNWAPDSSATLPSSLPPTGSTAVRPSFNRSVSSMSTFINSRSSSPSSTGDEKRRSLPRFLKSGTGSRSRRQSLDTPSTPVSIKTTVSTPSPPVKTRPRRANSIATTRLHSMSGSMRKRYALAFEDQTLPETEEERQIRRSTELLRIKELSLPSHIERPSTEIPATKHEPVLTPTAASIPSTPLSPTLPSPPQASKSERNRKTQSAYNPITTAGLWDSGVAEGPGLKSRPTSMFVINERKRKQDKKRERSKDKTVERVEIKDKGKLDSDYGSKAKNDWHKLKSVVKKMFKKPSC